MQSPWNPYLFFDYLKRESNDKSNPLPTHRSLKITGYCQKFTSPRPLIGGNEQFDFRMSHNFTHSFSQVNNRTNLFKILRLRSTDLLLINGV